MFKLVRTASIIPKFRIELIPGFFIRLFSNLLVRFHRTPGHRCCQTPFVGFEPSCLHNTHCCSYFILEWHSIGILSAFANLSSSSAIGLFVARITNCLFVIDCRSTGLFFIDRISFGLFFVVVVKKCSILTKMFKIDRPHMNFNVK